ncbi:uncharacterized protein PHACADRAFT_209279 [Phanerochaete carnosa HHB-10118-sp]|uniref:Uncharacterized protein n=1 Tax=Phanerochaete carnosa (strain HHB-10118-sp) TaxID=650164 RepID=K5UZX9_PHACS|nr:uncharacterized protein PHACADRAFT_209279 [Phanerochaete carnosa HHB-10118-sp]EKM55751.1 hypothetical protein PHACADRAFT_209279 [Phanerochaete carnosa HHB-10118-sp]
MSKFTPSPQEVALVNQIFAQADAQKIGVVTGEVAVKIFSGSKLPATTLAEIWNLADEDGKGVLTRKDVAVAVRLLGHAQRGERITEALVHKPGSPPSIEGLIAPISQQWTGSPKSPPPGPAAGLPPLTPQDKAKFQKLFLGCGPANGLLTGDKAREVFVKSKLPVEKLGQIWTLADTKKRGALDLTDFTIAMYLIQASMSGALPSVPPALPPHVYEQARPSTGGVATHATGGSVSFSPTSSGFPARPGSAVQPQHTGTAILQPQITGQRPAPPLPARTPTVPQFPLPTQATGQHVSWDVTPQEKATFDQFYDTLDTQRRGYIEGDVAVPFMLQSKLPDDILAQIWDLADYSHDGRLTRDGFAVAMHLIHGKLAGKEVPSTLPPTLIPPSVRGQISTTSTPSQPAQPAVPEAIRDLLWDDTPSSATSQYPTVSASLPPRTGTTSPKPTQPLASSIFDASDPFSTSGSPFVISHGTGQASAPAPTQVQHKDLLGDDEEPVSTSPPLQDKSAEIGNIQNQLHSTNRALETSKREREDLEKKVAEQATQLSALQTQLSSAKASYETEIRLLATLRERFSSQNTDIQTSRQELIRAESDLSAVRVEKAEVEGSLLRDKEEVRELQRKMAEVGSEVESLKAQVEKIKKEAKQQKGLLAIAKKQLASREAERAKVATELEGVQADIDATNKELQETEDELAKSPQPQPFSIPERTASPSGDSITTFAAAHPLPASPEPSLASPTSATSGKSNNPFERLTMGGAGSPRSQSPFLPFAGSAVLPTPPTGTSVPEQSAADPFGFDDAFGNDAGPSEEQPSDTTTPLTLQNGSPFGAAQTSGEGADTWSPTETEDFVTPQSTATLQAATSDSEGVRAASPPPASATSPAIEQSIPGHFPSIDGQQEKREETDLGPQLKDLEVSESDSDSEYDDEPLANVKAKLENQSFSPSASQAAAGPSTAAFDDSFGISSPQPTTNTSASSASSSFPSPGSQDTPKATITSPFPAPASPIENATSTNSESSAAGASDFDEALGKLPGSGGSGASQFSHVSQFTFESAFEDDFDFAAAKAASGSEPAPRSPAAPAPATSSAFPPVPTPSSAFPPVSAPSAFPTAPVSSSAFPPAPAQAPKSEGFDAIFLPQGSAGTQPAPAPGPAQAESSRPFSFDDVFGTISGAPANNTVAPTIQQVPSGSPQGLSFDDAFDERTSTATAHSPFSAFGSPGSAQHQSQPSSDVSQPPSQTSTPFPSSMPSSPAREASRPVSGSVGSRRSMSPPPRELSPPPRQSAKSRPSTAGSTEKEKSTRTSKLSIRLPFGRKKNKHDPMPSHLSQSLLVEEPPEGDATPAAEDDIDAVKTMCGMGFSRTQAVTALEQHDYDVQRALNSLLGTR